METLLPDIIIDILSRLPFESVLECRRVCKTWGSLIRRSSFAHMHLCRSLQLNGDGSDDYKCPNNSSSKVGILFLVELDEETFDRMGLEEDYGLLLYYWEYNDENEDESYKRPKKVIYHPPLQNTSEMVGSCNGLICLSLYNDLYGFHDPIYICNPITREYVNLPPLNNISTENSLRIRMASGFGYHSYTNEYKVVRIYYGPDNPSVGRVQVYTLGGGGGGNGSEGGRHRWRHKEDITYLLQGNYPPLSSGIFVNGALHWLDKELKIVVFDLADEEFRLLPSPPCLSPGEFDSSRLQVLGGCLCCVYEKKRELIDIWSLKKKKSCCYYDIIEQEYESCSWSKAVSISFEGTYEYKPFAITKSGEVLLWYNEWILSRYDPKTESFEHLVDHGPGPGLISSFYAITHANSFVSLKALGEEDIKLIGSNEDEESEGD